MTRGGAKKPSIRRCIACGVRSEKRQLLRFVVVDEAMEWDKLHRLPGRGAYVHRSAACWSKISDLAKWERAFRLQRGRLNKEAFAGAREAAYAEIRARVDAPAFVKGSRAGAGKVRL